MKKFEEFNNGNVTEVKSAIANGKATVIMYCSCGIKNCIKNIVEKDDIYSLYDHQSLIIVREEDTIIVCQLKGFYKKNSDNYIVIVEKVDPSDIFDRLKNAGIEDGQIYDSVKDIFDKALELKRKLEESKEKEEENEGAPDDIFDILNGKVNNKNIGNDDDDMPNPLDLLGKLLAVGAASSAIRKSVDPENSKWKIFKELEEKLGRVPTFEEFTNADPNLSREEKEKMIKTHKERQERINPGEDSFQRIMSKLLGSFEKDLERMSKH